MPKTVTIKDPDWDGLYKLRDHLAKRGLIKEMNTLQQWLYNNDPRLAGDAIHAE